MITIVTKTRFISNFFRNWINNLQKYISIEVHFSISTQTLIVMLGEMKKISGFVAAM